MQAVLWDMDGTLVDTEPYWIAAEFAMAEKYGAPWSDAHALRLVVDGHLVWRPYAGVPGVVVATSGTYRHEPVWYRNFLYAEERERGLDAVEDLASPGVFVFELEPEREAGILIATESAASDVLSETTSVLERLADIRAVEGKRRAALATRLERGADAYLVRRGEGKTIVAGYPWFTDWGRDTFIAIRGLCLATGRLSEARSILLEWAGAVSEGMLPNRFPDRGEEPEFNSVDASLWYVIAAHELIDAAERDGRPLPAAERNRITSAIAAILDGHARGTRFGIRADADGLLAAGVPGVQLTWMDARIGDRVITPRIGKPVEIQALWLNALAIGARLDDRWRTPYERGRASFAERFWNRRGWRALRRRRRRSSARRGRCELPAEPDPRGRRAAGRAPRGRAGAPGRRCRRGGARDAARAPLARSRESAYAPRYVGGSAERDAIYHQGTVWPWLVGPFVDAWVRVQGGTGEAKEEARRRFVAPLLRHLDVAGLGHVSEIADAESPHAPRGCPFQAWSLGELIRLDRVVLR